MTSQSMRASSGWIRLLGLFTVAGFVEAAFWGQLTAFTPLYLPHLGVRAEDVRTWTGVIVAVSGTAGIPFMPLWGALADKYSRQPIIIRSFVAHALTGILAVLAGNVWVFILARSVQVLSLGNTGLMLTTLSEHAPARRTGLAFSVMNGASPLGAFLGPLVGGPILDAWGFRPLMLIDVAFLIGVIVSLTFGYRDTFTGDRSASVLKMAFGSVGIIFHSPRLRALFPALFFLFAGWMLALIYLPLAITSLYHGGSPGTAVGIVVGAGGLTTLLISPLVGTLADRFGYWKLLFCGASLAVLLWPLPALTSNIVTFGVLWAVVNGIVSGVFAISFSVVAGSVGDHARGRIMSFAFLPINAGFAIGPAIGSVVTGGSVFAVFPTAALMTALGLGGLLLAYRSEPGAI